MNESIAASPSPSQFSCMSTAQHLASLVRKNDYTTSEPLLVCFPDGVSKSKRKKIGNKNLSSIMFRYHIP